MRLVNAHLVQEIADREIGGETASLVQYVLSHTPTIEAEPVRHGRWERKRHKLFGNSYDYVCSACGCDYALAEYDYCPNCGAKMDGGAE